MLGKMTATREAPWEHPVADLSIRLPGLREAGSWRAQTASRECETGAWIAAVAGPDCFPQGAGRVAQAVGGMRACYKARRMNGVWEVGARVRVDVLKP